MILTTTLDEIKKHHPCNANPDDNRDSGWNKLIDYLGHDWPRDKEINLLTILDSNGVGDCLWALRATMQESKLISVKMSIEFAKRVLHIFEKKYTYDNRPRRAIEDIKNWVDNPNEKNQDDAEAAARAAKAAAWDAGGARAVRVAARAAESKEQEKIIRRYLTK